MKTLIISGFYKIENKKVSYHVSIYGQTTEHPTCIFISHKIIECDNYSSLIDECKRVYCEYFKIDDFNIITLSDCLFDINTMHIHFKNS